LPVSGWMVRFRTGLLFTLIGVLAGLSLGISGERRARDQPVPRRYLVHVGRILPGMRAGRLGCSILLVEAMSRRVTATPGRRAE
jgi:hypothetical protein